MITYSQTQQWPDVMVEVTVTLIIDQDCMNLVISTLKTGICVYILAE